MRNLISDYCIKIACRLVRQNQSRQRNQCSTNSNSLLLSPGKMSRRVRNTITEPDVFERPNGPAERFRFRNAPAASHPFEQLHGFLIEGIGRFDHRYGHTSLYGLTPTPSSVPETWLDPRAAGA